MEWNLKNWFSGLYKRPENLTKNYYYAKISRLFMSQFSYKTSDLNNPNLIEYYIWNDDKAMVWKSSVFGWVVTRCVETAWDINGFAIRWRPVFDKVPSGIEQPKELTKDECVVIYDEPTRSYPSSICCKWIDEITDCNETIRSQIFNQKSPLIVMSKNPRQKQKVKQAVVDIAGNAKAIYVDEDIGSALKALKVDAPFNIQDLQAYLKAKESEMLEFLGIDSLSGFEKKERLITDEQESNNQILSYMIGARLECRKKACEKLRSMGLDIDVYLAQTFNPNEEDENDSEVEDYTD